MLASAPEDVRIVAVEGEGAKYWPQWRGPSAQGYVAEAKYTDTWSPASRFQWKAASPAAATPRRSSGATVCSSPPRARTAAASRCIAFSRADGRLLWETFIPQDGVEGVHEKNGYASATPATDGQRVYASFGRHGLVAIDLNGKIVWHRKFGVIDNYHGPAGSPVLYQDRIFLYQDQNPTRFTVGVRRRLRQGDRPHHLADARAPRPWAGARRSSSTSAIATSSSSPASGASTAYDPRHRA